MFKVLLIYFFLYSLSFFPLYAMDESFYLSAENIFKDNLNNFIEANGNVEIKREKIFVKANLLRYNLNKKEIFLEGNVRILSESGDVIFAKNATLNEDLKQGIINNLGVLFSDGSRLASISAETKENNKKTIYRNTVFTKCKGCENGKDVLWKLKARSATHLRERQIVLYKNVTLEAFSIPIAYVPFFYHPDPSVKSKSGLLTPKVSSSNVFGYTYEQPVYIRLKKNTDITLKPKVTSKEGLILAKEYRKKSPTGELNFNSSITYGSKVRINEPTKKEVRGHIDFEYANKINDDWILGANIKKALDKSYLARYGLSEGESVLTQNIFLEKGNIYNRFLIEGYKFQTLSDDFSSTNLPFIRPKVTYNINNYNSKNRKRLNETSIVLRSISNKKNNNLNSIHWINNSEKSYLLNGLMIKNNFKLNFDIFNMQNTGENSKDVIRTLPEVALQLNYPLINNKNNNSMVEPIIQLLAGVDNDKNLKIQNNDSRAVELTNSNLFEENKYSGFDRLEDGFRINYGIKYTSNYENKNTFYSSLGRSFYMKEQPLFNYTNGFGKNNSDFVGSLEWKNAINIDLNYDFRISDAYQLNKNRIKAGFDYGRTRMNFQYSQIRNFASSRNSDTEQINYSTSTKIFENWKLYFNQHRDLAGANISSPMRTSFGIEFKNICTLIKINLTKNKTNDIDVPASTNLAFIIQLF